MSQTLNEMREEFRDELMSGDEFYETHMDRPQPVAMGGVPIIDESILDSPIISTFPEQVRTITNDVAELLILKNKAYGNSALEPVRIFSQTDTAEQLRVRLDDKLSRMKTGTVDEEDTIMDLLGYLVLLKIVEKE